MFDHDLPLPPCPGLDRLTGMCQALNQSCRPCADAAEPDSRFCRHHGQLSAKYLRLYKTRNNELDDFLRTSGWDGVADPALPPTDGDAALCDDEGVLRSWHANAKMAWTLTHRVILSREHHHQQFHRGGDANHAAFVRILKARRQGFEDLMASIDRRLYHLMLAAEQAAWLLPTDQGGDEGDGPGCEAHAGDDHAPQDFGILTPPPSPLARIVELDNDDDDDGDDGGQEEGPSPEDILKQRRKTVQAKLMRYLDLCDRIEDPQTASERKEIVINVIRRIVSRDAGLMARARSFSQPPTSDDPATPFSLSGSAAVSHFITSDVLSLRELDRLWVQLKYGTTKITRDTIRRAIADLYRPCVVDAPISSRVWVLGGWVWRKAWTAALPRRGMDHFADFQGCKGCLTATCASFDEWSRTTLLATLGRYPDWITPSRCQHDEVFRLFRAQFQLAGPPVKPVKIEKIVPKTKGKGLKTVFLERQHRHFLYLRLPTTDERTAKIVDGLASRTDLFTVIAKRFDTNQITHRPPKSSKTKDALWCSRIRSGYTLADRRSAKFTAETALDESTAFGLLDCKNKCCGVQFTDVWHLVVMDNTGAGHACDFCMQVADVMLQAAGYLDHGGGVDEGLPVLRAAERRAAKEEDAKAHPAGSGRDEKTGPAFRMLFNEPLHEGEEKDFWS